MAVSSIDMNSLCVEEGRGAASPHPPSPTTTTLFQTVTAPETIPLQLICRKLTKHDLQRLRLVNSALCQAVSQHVNVASCAPDSPPLHQPLTALYPYLNTLILSHYPSPSRTAPDGPPMGLVSFLEHVMDHLQDALRTITHLDLRLHGSYDLTPGHAAPIHRLLSRCPILQSLEISTRDFSVCLRAPPPATPQPLAPPPTLHSHLSSLPHDAPLLDPTSWSAHPSMYTLALHNASDTATTSLLLPALHTPSLAHLTLGAPLPTHWLTHTLLTALTTPPIPLTALTHLHFSPVTPSPDGPPDPLLAAIPHLPSLHNLVLSPPPPTRVVWAPWHDPPAAPFTVPRSWSALTALTQLTLHDAALTSLCHLPTLRHLCHTAPLTPPLHAFSHLHALAALTRLDLRLPQVGVRPAMWPVHTARAFPPPWRSGLRHLELPCHNTAAALPQLTALTHLHLSCFPMTTHLALSLARLPNLAHLHLSEPIPRPDPPPAPAPPLPLAARPTLPSLLSLRISLSSNWSWDPLHVLATATRLPPRLPAITATDRCTVTDPRRLPPAPLHHWSPCWLLAALSADGEISIPLLDARDIDVISAAVAQLPRRQPAARPTLLSAQQQQLLLYAGSALSHPELLRALRLACGAFGRVSLYCHGWGQATTGGDATGSSTASLAESPHPQGPTTTSAAATATAPSAACNTRNATHTPCAAAAPPGGAPAAASPTAASPDGTPAAAASHSGPVMTITPPAAALAATAADAGDAALARRGLQATLPSLAMHWPSVPSLQPGTLAGLRRVHIDCRGLPCQAQLHALVAAAPQLEHLAATNAAHLCNRLLEQLRGSCPRLQNLWVSGLRGGITLAGLLPLLASARGLRGVTLHWCWEWVSAVYPWVPETVYARLAAACPAAALMWHKADSSTVELTLRRNVREPCQ